MNSTFSSLLLNYTKNEGRVAFSAPSNIALIKYWGKKDIQIPQNASLSLTLNNCKTTTAINYNKKNNSTEAFNIQFLFEGAPKPSFEPKILTFFERIFPYCNFLKDFNFIIESENTFPHSSGIASSASGMAAMARCIVEIENEIGGKLTEDQINKKTSFLARLGSGSACRSVEGPITIWGAHSNIENSNDEFAIKFNEKIHPIFKNYQDTILLVDKGEKQVSSTVGHNLMHNHPFAEKRFLQANENLEKLKNIIIEGNIDQFINIVESEALTLHAMMMTSEPYFILMKPNTLNIINLIWEFRKQTKIPVCFTLDAGANVHVLYPEKFKTRILTFINKQLSKYCQKSQYICDHVGYGVEKL